ncbi:outer membrane beta-barrel protein [Niabella hibiscisoli]|uniref:outer membrane beta-barrel protein n=1 Tax=Niabella hibiscisoli TaxID=1825928 RepID=UPI001F0FEBFD|nr:outer membrane beta-barrel protein [Niabella hibiscisoli]MCH5714774.1 outer membrane beta-barrel protein [Niabella hibiscisoli]
MKFYSITALFLSISVVSQAQQGWAVSDKVMIGHSWTVGNRTSDDMKYAFHPTVQFGRAAFYNFSDNIGIGLGTFFSTEGGRFKISDGSNEGKAEQRMNYVRIPLGAMFTFGDPASRVRPRLGLGGSVGFLVGGKTYLINEEDAFAGAKTTKIMSTKIDAGANASLGFSVRVADGFLINHDINYYHGLVENKYEATNLPSFTHRNVGLSMGFSITGDAMKRWKGKMKGMHHN